MFSILQLSKIQKFATTIYAVSIIIVLISTFLDVNIAFQQTRGIQIKYNPTPAQIASLGLGIGAIGALIGAMNSVFRLDQLIRQSRSGMKTPSIQPSIMIFAGSWLVFFGILAITIATQRRVEEEQEIVIF